jgi:hypothetical protein
MMLWCLLQFNLPIDVLETKRALGWLLNKGHNCFHCHTTMIFVCTIKISTHIASCPFSPIPTFSIMNTPCQFFQKHKIDNYWKMHKKPPTQYFQGNPTIQNFMFFTLNPTTMDLPQWHLWPFTFTWTLNQEHTPKHTKQICVMVGC